MPELMSALADGDRSAWLIVAVLIADILALVSLSLSREHSARARLVWLLIVVLIPVGGALAWLLLGRERRKPHLS